MNSDPISRRIFEFLNANELGILSTIHRDRNAPESAVVGFGNNERLELVFGTAKDTRKYQNLQLNPNVSLVIGWSSTLGSLQYEGIARELTQEELLNYAALLLAKNESNRRYLTDPDQRCFLVSPTWIRFYDNAGSSPGIHVLDICQ